MSMVLGWYVLVGFLWAVLGYHKNPLVVEARRKFGDLRIMPFMFIDVLIWPVEVVVMAGAVCVYVFRHLRWKIVVHQQRRAERRQILEAVRLVSEAYDQESYVCSVCGQVASHADVLKEKWAGMVPSGPGHGEVIWFCRVCQGWTAAFTTLTCVECGKTHTWDTLDSTTQPFGWSTEPDAINGMPCLTRWHCPECSRKKGA
jgi:hypothetical protein